MNVSKKTTLYPALSTASTPPPSKQPLHLRSLNSLYTSSSASTLTLPPRPSLRAVEVLRCSATVGRGGGGCRRAPGDRSDDVVGGGEDIVQLATLLIRALGA